MFESVYLYHGFCLLHTHLSWKNMGVLSTRWRMGCWLAIKAKADSFSFGDTDVEVVWNLYLEWPPPLHLSVVPYPQIIIYGPHTSAVVIEIEGQKIHLWIALVSHLKGFVGTNYFVLCLIAVVPVVFWTRTQDLKLSCVCLFLKVEEAEWR